MDNAYYYWLYQQQQMQMMGQYGNPWSPSWSYNQNPWGSQNHPYQNFPLRGPPPLAPQEASPTVLRNLPQPPAPAAAPPVIPTRPISGLPQRPSVARLVPTQPEQVAKPAAQPNTPAESDIPAETVVVSAEPVVPAEPVAAAEPVVPTRPDTPPLPIPQTQAENSTEPEVPEVTMNLGEDADQGGGIGSTLPLLAAVPNSEKSAPGMLREIRELRHPFFGSEGPPVDERPAKRVAVEGITLSKRMQTEPAINPPSKKTTKNSKRASARSSSGTSVTGSNTPTSLRLILPSRASSATGVNPSATNTSNATAPSLVPSSVTATTETPTGVATEQVDRKGDHLNDAYKRSLEGMRMSLGNIRREIEVIEKEIEADLKSDVGFADHQKTLQDIHDRFVPKLNMAKAIQAEMKMWITKK